MPYRVLHPMTASVASAELLLVDDDDSVRAAFCAYLADEGYCVMPFRRADAAWTAMVNGVRPRAIILDLALCGMSCGEFLRNLRATSWGTVVPVLVFTAWERAERYALAADAVLSKSAEAITVARTIDRLIERGRHVQPPTPSRISGARAPSATPTRRCS